MKIICSVVLYRIQSFSFMLSRIPCYVDNRNKLDYWIFLKQATASSGNVQQPSWESGWMDKGYACVVIMCFIICSVMEQCTRHWLIHADRWHPLFCWMGRQRGWHEPNGLMQRQHQHVVFYCHCSWHELCSNTHSFPFFENSYFTTTCDATPCTLLQHVNVVGYRLYFSFSVLPAFLCNG